MSKSKVILKVNSRGLKRGDTAEVDADVAEFLVREGHAVRPKQSPKKD